MADMMFIEEINRLSEQTIQLCYHCHKCTAGCPVAEQMEYGPDRILRMVQMGEKERLLKSHDIWICVSCQTCGTRCPNEIDTARVMAALREMAVEEKAAISEPDAVKFHRLFLGLLQYMGRMHEVSLLALQKVWTLNLFSDLDAGAQLFIKGKIPLKPHLVKNRQELKRIYAASSTDAKKASHVDKTS
jgi:heterodisulfide reductase subunit C2